MEKNEFYELIENAIQQTQETFSHYFERQTDEELRVFSNYVEPFGKVDGRAHYGSRQIYKDLPIGIRNYFEKIMKA